METLVEPPLVHQGLVFETDIVCYIHILPNSQIVLMPPYIGINMPLIPCNKRQWKPQAVVEYNEEYVQMWLALSTNRYKWYHSKLGNTMWLRGIIVQREP